MAKGRYRNVNPTAVALLFGGPKPANKLRMALARTKENPMEEETLTLDAEQAKLVGRLLKARDDEAKVSEAASDLNDEAKSAVVGAARMLAGIDPAAVSRALSSVGAIVQPPAAEADKPEGDAVARALAGAAPEVIERMRALEAQVAEARGLAEAERTVRERAEWIAKARAEMAFVTGDTIESTGELLHRIRGKLDAKDFDAVVARLKACSAAIQGGEVLKVHGRDGSAASVAGSAQEKLNAMAEAHAKEHKLSRERAMSDLIKTNTEARALYRQADEERS